MRNRERFERRRGAALVLVLLFAVGALAMTTTLLAMSTKGKQMQGETERQKKLQAVLKAGIAAAINEINRDEAVTPLNYDEHGDGVGALTAWNGTNAPGIPVIVDVAGRKETLGFYRTVITKSGGKDYLVVL